MGGIFICYRREDDSYAAGRLYDSLGQRFSKDQIFLDVDNIEPGQTFVEAIQERVAASDAMIVVIGPNWLDSTDSKGQRRLDNPKDFVRLEIEEALKRKIRVIPVLFDVAVMPQVEALPSSISVLTERQAVKFHRDSFSRDAEYLNNALGKVVAPIKLPDSQWKAKISPNRSRGYVSIEFSLSNEHHRIEYDTRGWTNKIFLDGVLIKRSPARKPFDFQVGSHSCQFQLKLHHSLTDKLSDIELWIDNQLILSAK